MRSCPHADCHESGFLKRWEFITLLGTWRLAARAPVDKNPTIGILALGTQDSQGSTVRCAAFLAIGFSSCRKSQQPPPSSVRRIAAIDYSPVFVEEVIRRNNDPRIKVQQADACALPFEGGTFDRAMALLVLHFVPEAGKAVAEMRRAFGRAAWSRQPYGTISAVCPACA